MLGSQLAFSLLCVALMLNFVSLFIIIRRSKFGYAGLLYCIYNIIFFIAPALLHTYNNIYPFYLMPYPAVLQENAAFVVLCFTIFFFVGFFFSKPKSIFNFKERKISPRKLKILFFICSAILVLAILQLGVLNFLTKRSEFDIDYIGQGPLANAALAFYRTLSFFILFFVLAAGRKSIGIKYFVFLAISIIIFFIVNFPLALPRYMLFAYILAIVFFVYPPKTSIKFLLFVGFFTGVVTLFPFINFLTRDASGGVSVLEYYGKSGAFDGFQSVMNVLAYVDAKGLGFGYQLLGVLFVFIPRELWPSKPFATGQSAAEFMGYPFTNISSPFVSELYVDFGALGVTLGAFLFGIFLRRLDAGTIFYRNDNQILSRSLISIICAFAIIFLRGSLIGVIANISLFIISAYIMGLLITSKSKKNGL